MANRPTSRQFQGHFNALRATRSHEAAQTIDIAAGTFGQGKVYAGSSSVSDPSWAGATDTFYVYLDTNDDLVLNGSNFPVLCTRIARVIIASGIIMDVIDERAEVNGLIDAYQVAFDDEGMNIAYPADDVQEAIELLDAYVWSFESAQGADIVKYIDLDVNGGIKNGLVRLGHLDNVPAVEFPKRPAGVGRVRYTASVPKDWVSNTDITIKIFWSPKTAEAGNVKWRLSWKVLASGDDIDAAMTTTSTIQATPGVINRMADTGSNLIIPSAQLAQNNILIINVEREYSVDDTYDSTARMHLVRMEYTGRGIQE
jgi:hypothetical protein